MREFHFFVVSQTPNLGMAVFGLVLVGIFTGAWWPLIAFGAAAIVMWVLGLETRVLCSHCPYWAEDGKTLRCWALTGSPKIWRYRPGPMNALERGVFLGFFLFLALFPPLAQGAAAWGMFADQARYGLNAALGMAGVTFATTLTLVQFVYTLRARYCSRCVNFSCPLNRVPRPLVNAYLARNRVMREAWEESGYQLSSPGDVS
jgi:hypothetical protein